MKKTGLGFSRGLTALLLAFAVLFPIVSGDLAAVGASDDTEFTDPIAKGVYLGSVTGEELYSYEAYTALNPDGLVKLMTLLLASEAVEKSSSLGRDTKVQMTLTAQDATPARSTVPKAGLSLGESVAFYDLLVLMFLGGGADASNLVAERVSGNIDDFVVKMNARAAELLCVSTYFTNPYGDDTPDQRVSAYDLYLIVSEGYKHSLFREIAGLKSATVSATTYHEARSYTTRNHIMNPSNSIYYMSAVECGRSMQSTEYGYSCAEAATRDGLTVVAVVLGSSSIKLENGSSVAQSLTEARRLLEWGYKTYSWREIVGGDTPIGSARVKFGQGADSVNLRPLTPVSLLIRKSVRNEDIICVPVIYSEETDGELIAPVKKGEIIGELVIYVENVPAASVKLAADTTVQKAYSAEIRDSLNSALHSKVMIALIITVAVIILGYIAYLIVFGSKSAKRAIARREKQRELAEQRRRRAEIGSRSFTAEQEDEEDD